MAELLGATETEFETDFAILTASQGDRIDAGAGSFAGSTVGGVAALCGTKYAHVRARAERWSARPDSGRTSLWEDEDELPFVATDGDGDLQMSGFDPASGDHALDLDGFGTGRVIVMARGRHRYNYGDGKPPQKPEEWLFQFFPEGGPVNPLAGPPRRINGFTPFSRWSARSGWLAALHAWKQTGWHAHLISSPGFRAVELGLSFAQRSIDARELADASSSYTRSGSQNPAPFPPDPLDIELGQHGDDPLELLFGAPIRTMRDAVDALISVQLLLTLQRDGSTLLIPNPDPGFVWDKTVLTENQIAGLRLQIGYADFRRIAEDMAVALNWSGFEGLGTTVREMGTRWSATSADIRGGLELLKITAGLTVSPTLGESPGDDDLPIRLKIPGR